MNEVRFNLKDTNATKSLIYLLFSYNKNRIKLSTGLSVPPSHWNKKSQKVREIAGKPEYYLFNKRLKELKSSMEYAYQEFHSVPIVPTKEQLRLRYKELINDDVTTNSRNNIVIAYVKNFMEIDTKLKLGTLKDYKQLLKVLEDIPRIKDLHFVDFKFPVLNKFVEIMENQREYSNSQMHKLQSKLIAIFNRAQRAGIEVSKEISYPEWRVVLNAQSSGIALTDDEIKKIQSVELPINLDRVRERFMIGLNTGQRISDFRRLNKDNIISKEGKKFWSFIQQKTGREQRLPVNDICNTILNKYDGYPPVMSDAHFNRSIKKICRLADINREVVKFKKDSKGNEIKSFTKKVQVCDIITSHDCRRTLATNLHDKGVPLSYICYITGHKSIKSLSNYLKINLDSVTQVLNEISTVI